MQNSEIKKLYKKIRVSLKKLIPEQWQSIYLYASVVNGKNGEMFFYYYPKKLIKANPINCYDVPDKFGIDENTYNNKLKKVYSYIRALNNCMGKKWTNITIIIKDNFFTIEYHFNDLVHSKYDDEQRRKVWCHKYLQMPLESMNAKDRILIEHYQEETKHKPVTYSEVIDIFDDEENDDKVEIEIEKGKTIKNQILKF